MSTPTATPPAEATPAGDDGTIVATVNDDGTGSVTLPSSGTHEVTAANADDARDDLIDLIAAEAANVGAPLRVEAREPAGIFHALVHPNGDVEPEQPQAGTAPKPSKVPTKARSSEHVGTWKRIVVWAIIVCIGVGVLVGIASLMLSSTSTEAPNTQDASAALPADQAQDAASLTARAWQGAALPTSPEHGPALFTDTRSSGFSATPLGAALAAVHISSHISPYTGPPVFAPTVQEQVAGDTDKLLARLNEVYASTAKAEGLRDGEPSIRPTGEMVSWRLAGPFSVEAETDVEIVVRTPASDDQVFTIPVIWDSNVNDWKINPARQDGGLQLQVTDPDPNAEYTPFFPSTTN